MIQCLVNCKGGLEYVFSTNSIKDIMAKTELQKESLYLLDRLLLVTGHFQQQFWLKCIELFLLPSDGKSLVMFTEQKDLQTTNFPNIQF